MPSMEWLRAAIAEGLALMRTAVLVAQTSTRLTPAKKPLRLDDRVVNGGQVIDGKVFVGEDAEQDRADREERGHDGAPNERFGEVHGLGRLPRRRRLRLSGWGGLSGGIGCGGGGLFHDRAAG